MRRSKGKTACVPLAALIMALALTLCACAPGSSSGGIATSPMHGPELVPNEYSQAIIRNSLTIVSRKAEMDGCRVKYPYVCNANMELLNISIHSAVTEFVADCETEGASIECTVEFNRYGLLSLLAVCTLPNGKTVNTDAMNFDCDTGLRVGLHECFGKTEADYKARLNDLLRKSIQSQGLTVIGSDPEVNDDTLFLFTYDGIFLLFREYELFSYDAGAPRIKIKLASVFDLLAPDGLLNRVK